MNDFSFDNLEGIRAFFKADRFATDAGAEIDWVRPGEAQCTLVMGPQHQNAAGIIQGGVLFTLADFAFAVAANATHPVTVSLNNQISFLKPPKGTKLIATARQISLGTTTCLYEVEVTDDRETRVAHMTVTGFIRSLKNK